jgi:hypothetical protein
MKALKMVLGLFFVISGILFFIFLRLLNDPEVEGESGRISFGLYCYALIPITIGMVILLFPKDNSKPN